MSEPCGWTIDQCGCGDCWTSYTPAVRTRAAALASGHMWAATGRRYGLCEVTAVVCEPAAPEPLYQTFPIGSTDTGAGPASPYLAVGGGWRNRGCGGGCSCAAACEVALDGPVDSIVEVTVADVLVDPDVYEVHDRHLLVRTDGTCWPSCGSVAPPYGMTVTYLRGESLYDTDGNPRPVLLAAQVLACQYAKACTGAVCALPARMTALSRQGVDIQVADAAPDGSDWWMTGIDVVDRVIAADNPGHLTGRPEVWTPDLPRHRTVTAVGGS